MIGDSQSSASAKTRQDQARDILLKAMVPSLPKEAPLKDKKVTSIGTAVKSIYPRIQNFKITENLTTSDADKLTQENKNMVLLSCTVYQKHHLKACSHSPN
ncbi:uncharacterized protein BO80DRAFT_434480 [Aspergillus ibericus CBS 121593]|uniref:Uncharacterized protein n=1 Tax=Aspergillus ibericus CBS 121593 TaxID=1448316 RepID=A0A395H4R0_9EURO|nr:hypothetical protein BO80DRAFT_434480 [Aspergillus ibericus CBS 121593]RAL01204.1 hypothetical protein BO80DRAFT_434480 [Aspergillus ibericus CBS 121593]